MSKKDWAGLKFKLMKEMGECIEMIYIKDFLSNKKPEYFFRSHDKSDGISAFIDILKTESSIEISSLPTVKTSSKPSLFKRIKLATEHVKRQKPISYNWKKIDKLKKGAGAGIVYTFFSRESSKQIELFCKEQGYNINSFLLWALDVVSKNKFLNTKNSNENKKNTEKRVWMMPVNMRLPGVGLRGNFVTTLSVHLYSSETPYTIYNQIKSMMKSGIIWGGWIVANAPKYIGEKGLRLLGKNLKSPYLGLCSNLGSWPPEKDIENINFDNDVQWIIAAPVTSFCPVSSVVVTWNGRIGLSCQLHPSLSTNLLECEELVKEWCELLTKKSNLKNDSIIKKVTWSDFLNSAKEF